MSSEIVPAGGILWQFCASFSAVANSWQDNLDSWDKENLGIIKFGHQLENIGEIENDFSKKKRLNILHTHSRHPIYQLLHTGCRPLPLLLLVVKAGRNHLNEEITPPPPHWDKRGI